MRLRAIVTALVLLTGLLSSGSQPADAEAITIWLQPSHAVADVGETFLIMVFVDSAVDLGAFEFHLGYNPAVLEATDAELGPFLTSTGRSSVPLGPLVTGGEIRFGAASYGTASGPNGAGIMAQVAFRVVGSGTSALTFNRVIITDTHAQVLPAGANDGTFAAGKSPYRPVFLPLVLNQSQ